MPAQDVHTRYTTYTHSHSRYCCFFFSPLQSMTMLRKKKERSDRRRKKGRMRLFIAEYYNKMKFSSSVRKERMRNEKSDSPFHSREKKNLQL